MKRKSSEEAVNRVHKSDHKLVSIDVNDVFEELIHQNRELQKQIKLFIEFKLFFGRICVKLNSHLNEKDLNELKTFHNKFNDVFGDNITEINFIKREGSVDTNKCVALHNNTQDLRPQNEGIQSYNRESYDSNDIDFKFDEIKNVFICPEKSCNKFFKNKLKINTHYTTVHLFKHNNNPLKGPQSNCNKSFKVRNCLKTKDKLQVKCGKKRIFVCDYVGCGKTYPYSASLRAHKLSHSNEFLHRCDWPGCEYATNYNRHLLTHQIRHKDPSLKPFKCEMEGCGASFWFLHHLNDHTVMKHHGNTEKIFKCDYDGCLRAYKNKLSLKLHSRRDHIKKERTAFCDVEGCHFRTFNRFLLDAHKVSHSQNRPFICSFDGCDKSFKTKHSLKYHRIKCHIETDRPFKCSEPNCDKDYKYSTALKRHIAMDHEKHKFSCGWPGCDFSTGTANHMKRHETTHRPERHFVCEWPECGKAFKFKRYLTEHMAMHRNDKRYACLWPGCQYRCITKSNLSKHEKIHKK